MGKSCCYCKEVKDVACFTKDRSRTDGLDNKCRDCKKISNKNSQQRYKSSGNRKIWRDRNREHVNNYHNEWLAKNPGYCRKYVLKNTMLYRMFAIKHYNKRKRELGFIPINAQFPGSEAHHINKEQIIYIPSLIHKSISHNLSTGKNMKEINALALDYLFTSATI